MKKMIAELLAAMIIFMEFPKLVCAAEWQNNSHNFDIEGRYIAISYETRLNTDEPSEGCDPYKVTRLYIDKQGNSYRLMITLETLKHLNETVALFDYCDGQTEFIATVGDKQGWLASGDKIWFRYDGRDIVDIQKISNAYGDYEELNYMGGYQKIDENTDSSILNNSNGLNEFYMYRNTNIRRDEAIEVVNGYLRKKGAPEYWSIVEDQNVDVLEIWVHWSAGLKGKITADLKTGNCYEEIPYLEVNVPYENIPVEKNYLFNLYDYLYFYEQNDFILY